MGRGCYATKVDYNASEERISMIINYTSGNLFTTPDLRLFGALSR